MLGGLTGEGDTDDGGLVAVGVVGTGVTVRVGNKVADGVGAAVGCAGVLVGLSDGAAEGDGVGAGVGLKEGARDGDKVTRTGLGGIGVDDGTKVGILTVGDSVSISEGATVGFVDGNPVVTGGSEMGATDGAKETVSLGLDDGASVKGALDTGELLGLDEGVKDTGELETGDSVGDDGANVSGGMGMGATDGKPVGSLVANPTVGDSVGTLMLSCNSRAQTSSSSFI